MSGSYIDDDEQFEEELKASKSRSASRAGVANSESGTRVDKPTYVDPRVLDQLSISEVISR